MPELQNVPFDCHDNTPVLNFMHECKKFKAKAVYHNNTLCASRKLHFCAVYRARCAAR